MYLDGRGVKQDYAQAAQWYRKAADQGNARAQYNLGTLYEAGNGVEKDVDKAVEWFRKAAKQGEPGRGEANRADRKDAESRSEVVTGSSVPVASSGWSFPVRQPITGAALPEPRCHCALASAGGVIRRKTEHCYQ